MLTQVHKLITLMNSGRFSKCSPSHGHAHRDVASSALRVHDHTSAPSLIASISTLILDCDGVLWRGSTVTPNAPQAITALRTMGKQLRFLTNNSSKSRRGYVDKFRALGFDVPEEEVLPSSYMAAAYLKSIGFDGKVFLIGQEGIEEELRAAGISFVGGTQYCDEIKSMPSGLESLKVDEGIGAVVVGWDPAFSYSKLCYAASCINEIPGCLFIATNADQYDILGTGRRMPGTGSILTSIEAVTDKKAVVVGKGGPWLLPWLKESLGVGCNGIDERQVAVVGDRLDTDIAIGIEGGFTTFLPLTGVTQKADLEEMNQMHQPDHVLLSFSNITGLP